MRKTLKAICLIGMTLAASVSLCACFERPAKHESFVAEDGTRLYTEGTLTCTASLHNTPFEDKTAYEPYGFTVELTKLIAQELGWECTYTDSKYSEALAAGVQVDGDADLVASSVLLSSVGEDSSLVYTDSYIDFDLGLAVNKHSDFKSADDLVGCTIGVEEGTDSEDYATQLKEQWESQGLKKSAKTNIATYDSDADALSDLQAHNVDAVIAEYPVLKYYTRVMYYRERVIQEFTDATQGYVFAVASDNQVLAQKVNEALASLKESGAYQELYDSWFNMDEEASNPDDPTVPPQDQQGFAKYY